MADETMEIDGALVAGPPKHASPPAPSTKDNFREIQVKVHVRQADKDSWLYLGRGVVTQEAYGQSSRVVVVRHLGNGKPITTFGEASQNFVCLSPPRDILPKEQSTDLQAEKRGNFVVIGCLDGNRVVSWSLNALNNSETLRLLASIELACYKCKQVLQDPRLHHKARRRIERLIKDDRRKRHRRRKDQEALIDAFAKQNIGELPMEATTSSAGANPAVAS